MDHHLLPWLDRQMLLVSDAHAAYRSFAHKHAIAHEAVNLRAGVRVRRGAAGAIHVQNVNAYPAEQLLRLAIGVINSNR